MKRLFLLVTLFCLLAIPAKAHRLDEYLQAGLVSIEPGTVTLSMRMVPGVDVAPAIITSIDRNADDILSAAEQRAYVEQVQHDLLFREDGHPLPLRIVNASFPSTAAMRSGTGQIELTFTADLPAARGRHELDLVNHHQSGTSVYLVNALVPQHGALQIEAQSRSQNQSSYQLTFTDAGSATVASQPLSFSGFNGAFRLGLRHIAEGTDHLLFLLTLLLPAPLLAFAGRWSRTATLRQSLLQILRIITAFTLGHSVTLALACFDVVRLPSRPVEVLIALSILVSAVHAGRPIFPGKEATIAAFFGLIHGLAFASALNQLGVTGWYRLISLLGFNLGIEAMQLAAVAVVLPSLLLLSRTPFYGAFRICGALSAACASLAWIAERVMDKTNVIGSFIEQIAKRSLPMALALLGASLLAWLLQRRAGFPLHTGSVELNHRSDFSDTCIRSAPACSHTHRRNRSPRLKVSP